MKKSLIIKYVAKKLTQVEPALNETQKVFGNIAYLEIVKGSLVSELPPKFKAEIEALLRKRFNLKQHACVFSAEMTVEQWIADITGLFSEEDILAIFSQISGVPVDTFRKAAYGSNILNRPFLEDIVEMLEAATGRKLTDEGYLSYNDMYAYADIAKFFATR